MTHRGWEMTKPLGLPKGVRLRAKRDIGNVFGKGRYHALGVLHAKTIPTGRNVTRFQVSVKKAIGNAPKRNRIKRLVREAMRMRRRELGAPHDICFFLTKKPPALITLSAIEKEIETLIDRLSRGGRGR